MQLPVHVGSVACDLLPCCCVTSIFQPKPKKGSETKKNGNKVCQGTACVCDCFDLSFISPSSHQGHQAWMSWRRSWQLYVSCTTHVCLCLYMSCCLPSLLTYQRSLTNSTTTWQTPSKYPTQQWVSVWCITCVYLLTIASTICLYIFATVQLLP